MRSTLLVFLVGCATTQGPAVVESHQTGWFRCPSISGPTTNVVMVTDETGVVRPVLIDASMQANAAWYCGRDPNGIVSVDIARVTNTGSQPPVPKRPLGPVKGVHDAPVKPVYTSTAQTPAPRPTSPATGISHAPATMSTPISSSSYTTASMHSAPAPSTSHR